MNPLALTSAILSLAPELQKLVGEILEAIKGSKTASVATRKLLIFAGRKAILRG